MMTLFLISFNPLVIGSSVLIDTALIVFLAGFAGFNPLVIGSSVLISRCRRTSSSLTDSSFNPLVIGSSVLIEYVAVNEAKGVLGFNPLVIGSSVLIGRKPHRHRQRKM